MRWLLVVLSFWWWTHESQAAFPVGWWQRVVSEAVERVWSGAQQVWDDGLVREEVQ